MINSRSPTWANIQLFEGWIIILHRVNSHFIVIRLRGDRFLWHVVYVAMFVCSFGIPSPILARSGRSRPTITPSPSLCPHPPLFTPFPLFVLPVLHNVVNANEELLEHKLTGTPVCARAGFPLPPTPLPFFSPPSLFRFPFCPPIRPAWAYVVI